jgi:hypothetical protein
MTVEADIKSIIIAVEFVAYLFTDATSQRLTEIFHRLPRILVWFTAVPSARFVMIAMSPAA